MSLSKYLLFVYTKHYECCQGKNQQSIVLIHGSCSLRVIHIFVILATSHSAKKKNRLQPRFFSCFVFGDRLVSSVWSSCFSLPSAEVVGRDHYNPAMTKMSSSLSPSLPLSLLAALDLTMWSELKEIHLWLPLQCWDQRHVLPQPTRMRISNQVYLILNLIYTVTHWHYCGSLFNVYNDWAVCWQIWHFNSSHHISIIIMEKKTLEKSEEQSQSYSTYSCGYTIIFIFRKESTVYRGKKKTLSSVYWASNVWRAQLKAVFCIWWSFSLKWGFELGLGFYEQGGGT